MEFQVLWVQKKTQQALNIIYKINLLKIHPFKPRFLQIYLPRTFSEENTYNKELINEIIEFSVYHRRVV